MFWFDIICLKEFILLIIGVAGWLPPRQANEVTWNRTCNVVGGPGHNLALDLKNEFDNKDFTGDII